MKKQVFTLLTAIVCSLISIGAWAQSISLEDVKNPEKWFYTTLVAQPSTASMDAGKVKLTIMDMNGVVMSSDYRLDGYELTELIRPLNPDMEKYVEGANTKVTGYTEFKNQVALTSFALVYMPGVETEFAGIPLSSYAYFKGEVQINPGWYFAGWSYTDGAIDLGKDGNFKLLPSNKPAVENKTTNKVYATFKPVLVSGYKVNGLINGTSGTTTIEYTVSGEDIDYNDFTVSVEGENFSVENLTESDCAGDKVTVKVAYSGAIVGEYSGKVTLASKSGKSKLTAPVYARVSEDASTEATLYDGKTAKQYGNIADMIAAIGTLDLENPIISLNKNYTNTLATTSTFTLDLNGYDLSGLAVNGGELTVAYSKYGGNINSTVAVNAGKLILNGATITAENGVTVAAGATLEQNGATINATKIAIENNGTTIINEGVIEGTSTAGVKSAGTLTINGGVIKGNYALWVANGSAEVKKGTLTGTAYGIYSGATTSTEKLATIYGGKHAVYVANGTTTLNNGKFDGSTPLAKQSEGTLNIEAGYFKTDTIGVELPTGKKLLNVSAGVEYNAGYRYFVGDDESAQLSGVGVCKIGTTAYATLEDALAYANNNPTKEVVIVMLNDYVLPAGYYTLPAKATLIVPMADNQETAYPTINRVSDNSVEATDTITPSEFRRLTFASGVNMEVFGTIELTGTQRASDDAYASMPHGAYGHLVMNEGSKMVLQNGSELRAWGYMTGEGETDARRGAIVREQFQMADWKGGSASFAMLSDGKGVFPITQYFIQNIESPVKYHPGAVLSTTASVSAVFGGLSVTAQANDVKIIGVAGKDDAMFLMDNQADAENTWVRKWYNADEDQQTYEVNSGAHIGSMVLDLGRLGTEPLVMNSGIFVLPITNNMKIHLLSGYMDFTQSTSLLPGAVVEIDKKSTVSITKSSDTKSGSLYIYGQSGWGTYAHPNKYTKVVNYSATLDKKPDVRKEDVCPASAAINVHGTFDSDQGYVYTYGDANIYSTNADAGTFIFTEAAPTTNDIICQRKGTKQEDAYAEHEFQPAKLKNGLGEPAYAETAGTEAGKSFCYMNNKWTLLEVYENDSAFMVDNDENYYIKPAEYVIVKVTKDSVGMLMGNDDHTYSDNAGDGRLFILTYGENDTYQWWEVEKKDNLYYSAKNDTYYYWDDVFGEWVEKQYTITWQNWNGEKIISYDYSLGTPTEIEYSVPYGTMAEYLGTNPTREADIDYTYDFAGWTPELGKVTSDVTYTATYTKKERKYTIIFQTEGGVEIERQFLTHNQVPVCENMPTKVGHYLEWQPAIAAVIGDATYTATWLEEKPTEYTITFVDYNGTDVLQSGKVPANTMPTAPAEPTGKPATDEYRYEFDHWSPALAVATENMTYTAVYKEVEKTYTISYYKEDGTTLITTEELAYGATPTPPVVIKENPETGYVYTLVWKTLDEASTIQTVTGEASYKPTYIKELNIMPVAEIIRDGLTVGQWGTLCPTQNVENPTGATFYQIAYLEEKGGLPFNIHFDEVEGNLEAAQPYFFIASATEVKGVKSGEVKNEGSNVNGFYGYIGETSWTLPYQASFDVNNNNTFVIWNNSVFRINAATSIKSERCYININSSEPIRTSTPAPVGARRITMGVSGINGQNTATGVDQVQGDEVQSTKVLINGQMFIYRNGKMYDAQGKLVK